MRKFSGEIWIGLAAVLGVIGVILLGVGLSLLPAIVVGGLISWITGLPFLPTMVVVWILTMLFGRNR